MLHEKPETINGRERVCRKMSLLFLLFLKANGLLGARSFDNRALVALALLTAASESGQKEILIRLIMNLIAEGG
ncbi:MAG: hypothetical protein MUO63_16690 [Desulfobulbaceae bacterium]|nr:hypothetical protein [Desulfobulbaceae bacterium]